jgi:Uma2 family endonuclease
MSDDGRKRASYDDVAAAPEDVVAEIVEGDLHLSPRPSPRHARVATTLASALHLHFDQGKTGPGGWWILFEPEIHLGGDVLVPDVAGWKHETLAELPELPWFDQAPDWLCEVISPATERVDRKKKMPVYAEAGVEHLWLIDPSLRTLEVFRRDGSRWARVEAHFGEEIVSAPPFEAVPLELAPLWRSRV